MCSAREDAKEAEQNSRKKSTEENQRSLTCLRVGVEGLEYLAKTRRKVKSGLKLTPNPTLSETELKLVEIFRQLTINDQSQLIDTLKAIETKN